MELVNRYTVDLNAYPDLVIFYGGMKANTLGGIRMVRMYQKFLRKALKAEPEGLLAQDHFVYSYFPLHYWIRTYWRDFDSMENWARQEPHMTWWKTLLENPDGIGVWHEVYFKKGGMEGVFDNMPINIGFAKFAPKIEPLGSMFFSRGRAEFGGCPMNPAPLSEEDLYRKKEDRKF